MEHIDGSPEGGNNRIELSPFLELPLAGLVMLGNVEIELVGGDSISIGKAGTSLYSNEGERTLRAPIRLNLSETSAETLRAANAPELNTALLTNLTGVKANEPLSLRLHGKDEKDIWAIKTSPVSQLFLTLR